jgi:hypothetical protein
MEMMEMLRTTSKDAVPCLSQDGGKARNEKEVSVQKNAVTGIRLCTADKVAVVQV